MNLQFIILLTFFVVFSFNALPSYGEINNGLNNATVKDTNSTGKAKGKTLFGLLGFLSGYRLGQSLGPTSYHSDFKESAQLNFFGKLFNAALYFAYDKYPHMHNLGYPPYPLYPPYPPYSQNIYPTNLQPPIWHPSGLNPLILASGHSPANQQQIVNVHEPFNPYEAPNENYQELSEHIQQGIHNNFDSNNRPLSSEAMDKIDTNLTTSVTNETNSKKALCLNKTCIEAIESDAESLEIDNITETTTIHTIELDDNKNISIDSSRRNDSVSDEIDNISQSTVNMNITTDVHKNQSSNNKYPFPIYHYYENASKYEHVSITEKPLTHQRDFLLKPDYNEYENYLPKLEIIVPYADAAKESSFYPMGGNYYESGPGYTEYVERFNKKQEESDFVPMQAYNYV